MRPSKRIKRFLEVAKRAAFESDHDDYRHGAVLVKGGSVRNMSKNKNRLVGWAYRFRNRNYGHATLHAEIGCILGLDRSITRGATIYVVRIGKNGGFRMSKPCQMCEEAMRHVGIKKVIYTADKDAVEVKKI